LFDATSDLFFDVTLAEVAKPGNQTVFGGQHVVMQSSNTPWSHDRPPLYPSDPAFPSGDFYAASPWTFSVNVAGDATGTISFVAASVASVPEPSTSILAALGLLSLLPVRPRQRQSR